MSGIKQSRIRKIIIAIVGIIFLFPLLAITAGYGYVAFQKTDYFQEARKNELQKIIDSGCKKYYDGCNSCQEYGVAGDDKTEKKSVYCTLLACSAYGWPYCKDE